MQIITRSVCRPASTPATILGKLKFNLNVVNKFQFQFEIENSIIVRAQRYGNRCAIFCMNEIKKMWVFEDQFEKYKNENKTKNI